MRKPSKVAAMATVGVLFAGAAVLYFLSRPAESELSATKPSQRPPQALAAAQAVFNKPGPDVKRMLESLPSASAPALAASNPVRKGLLGLNVGQIYQQALEAKNPEDRSLAFFFSADCHNIASTRTFKLKELLTGTEAKLVADHPMAAVYDRWVASSRQEMEAFCSTGDRKHFVDKMTALRDSTGQAVQGRVWIGVVLRSDKANSPERQEYFQAMTQVLSAPSQYPAHFDRWASDVSFGKLTRLLGAARSETALIADSLFQRFGMGHMVGYRQMRRCSLEYMCLTTDMLPEAKRRQIEMVAEQIEQLIRTQRWDVLLAPRD